MTSMLRGGARLNASRNSTSTSFLTTQVYALFSYLKYAENTTQWPKLFEIVICRRPGKAEFVNDVSFSLKWVIKLDDLNWARGILKMSDFLLDSETFTTYFQLAIFKKAKCHLWNSPR